MAVSAEGANVLREWAPLTDLFNKLPTRIQNGIFNNEVKLTCVDVLSDFVALGTNLGIVYWYNRKNNDLQRLRCENSNVPITVVKVISTVDYMLACGNKNGNISIFQIPKSHPDNLPESLKPKNKQVERYTVADMHKGPISAIEWSKNGMKLFSGDNFGLVVLTEIDFYMHISKSVEILNEAYEVVQLSYHQQNLLISTTFRSIVCRKEDKWKISQVGKKDRKVFGNFGGVFHHNCERPGETVVYCARPGLRIWSADATGLVKQTLLFKEVLSKGCVDVPIINPISGHLRKLRPTKEASFGVLLRFRDDFLVTYGSEVVYVLNPKDLTIVSMVNNLRGILSVATTKEEIFILEEERSLIRIAYQPEYFNEMKHPIPTASAFTPLSSSIRELTSKFQNSGIMSVIPPIVEYPQNAFCIHTDVTSVISAEEAVESPANTPPKRIDTSEIKLIDGSDDKAKKAEIYNKISEEEFNDTILFKHHTRKKHYNMSTSITSVSSSSSDERDGSISRPVAMNLSTVSIYPDLRSPDTIMNDIVEKEKLLADVLNFDKIKLNVKPRDVASTSNGSVLNGKSSKSTAVDVNLKDEEKPTAVDVNLKDEEKPSYTPNINVCNRGLFETESKSTIVAVNTLQIPALVNIPNDWNLSKVKLSVERNTSESDVSLTDWELI